MTICQRCANLGFCEASKYDIDFLKYLMVAVSSRSYSALKDLYKIAKDMGYDVREVFQFLERTQGKCLLARS